MLGAVGGNTMFSPVHAAIRPDSVTPTPVGGVSTPRPDEGVSVSLSEGGRKAAKGQDVGVADNAASTGTPEQKQFAGRGKEGAGVLTRDDLKQIDQLKARDRAVRAHEQAHQAAAGALVSGGASYTYQRGPDGVNYAIGGEVRISMREGRTPEQTIVNAQIIRAAALAPADPSPQDRAVAAAAGQMEAKAQAELVRQESAESLPEKAPEQETTPTSASGKKAVERTRADLADVYGLLVENSTGFAARA